MRTCTASLRSPCVASVGSLDVLAALEDAGLDVADVPAPQVPSTPATKKDFGDGASSRPKNLVVPSHLSNLSAIGEKSLDGHMSRLAQRSESPEGRAHSGLAMMVGTARRGGARGTNGGTDHGDIKEEGQMKPHAARKLFD